MQYFVRCCLLALFSIAAAQRYPYQPSKGPITYHPRQAPPQSSYNVNKQVQYEEYHQQPYQLQQYQQPTPVRQSTLFLEPSIKTSSGGSSYTQYRGRDTTDRNAAKQKPLLSSAVEPIASVDSSTKPRTAPAPEPKPVVTVYKTQKVVEEEIEVDDDDIDLNEINDSATRATMLWRSMAAQHPHVAAKAAMYWRVMAVRDAKKAAEQAMAARKMIATGPEEMARVALAGVEKQQRISKRASSRDSIRSQSQMPPYWREYAAHDPEVTARSAMYWVNDDQADMYW